MTAGIFDAVATLLPEAKVLGDVRSTLDDAGFVELDDTRVSIPRNCTLQLLARSVHRDELGTGFGNHLCALVAVGGAQQLGGVVVAGICFATVWYNADGNQITMDFSTRIPWNSDPT